MQFTMKKLIYNEEGPYREFTNVEKNDQEEVPVKKLKKKKEKH